jgi:cardiolipin synthase
VIVLGAGLYQWRVGNFVAEPSVPSKLNSALQLLYVLMTLSWLAFELPGPEALFVLGLLVLATTVFSGLDYVIRWTRRAHAART